LKDLSEYKIAITHDHLYEFGGAEQVLWSILKLFPQADVYTSIYRPGTKQRAFWAELNKHKVVAPRLGKIKSPRWFKKMMIPRQISFFKNLDLENYDLVISSSAAFAKYLNLKKPKHIGYIHTPPRFIWGYESSFYSRLPNSIKRFTTYKIEQLKTQDLKYAKKIDLILTNSLNIKEKIKKCYNLDAQILYPPVNLDAFTLNFETKDNYYLTIGRLYNYKKIDLIVDAFREIDSDLIIIGDGPEKKSLKSRAKKNAIFKGFVDESVKLELLARAKGFIFAAEEDFGIVMVEALASGCPLIAYKAGGATEILIENTNGRFFEPQTSLALKDAIEKFENQEFDIQKIRKSAERYSESTFTDNLIKQINKII